MSTPTFHAPVLCDGVGVSTATAVRVPTSLSTTVRVGAGPTVGPSRRTSLPSVSSPTAKAIDGPIGNFVLALGSPSPPMRHSVRPTPPKASLASTPLAGALKGWSTPQSKGSHSGVDSNVAPVAGSNSGAISPFWPRASLYASKQASPGTKSCSTPTPVEAWPGTSPFDVRVSLAASPAMEARATSACPSTSYGSLHFDGRDRQWPPQTTREDQLSVQRSLDSTIQCVLPADSLSSTVTTLLATARSMSEASTELLEPRNNNSCCSTCGCNRQCGKQQDAHSKGACTAELPASSPAKADLGAPLPRVLASDLELIPSPMRSRQVPRPLPKSPSVSDIEPIPHQQQPLQQQQGTAQVWHAQIAKPPPTEANKSIADQAISALKEQDGPVDSGVGSPTSPRRMWSRPGQSSPSVGGSCSGRASRKSMERSVSRSVSRRCGVSRARSADIAQAHADRPRPYAPEQVSSPPSPLVPLSRGSRGLGACGSRGAGVRSSSRHGEVALAADRSHMENAVQACTGVGSNAGRDPLPSMPMSPSSFRRNQQITPQHPRQELRDRSSQSRELACRRQSLPSHVIKATPVAHVATSDTVRTPRASSPLLAAAVPASPPIGPQPGHTCLPSRFSSPVLQSPRSHEAAVAAATAAVARTVSAARRRSQQFAEAPKTFDQRPPLEQSSRASLLSGISSAMPQSPHTQGVEKPLVEEPPDSMAAAAAAAAAAATAAAASATAAAVAAAGFRNEGVPSPAGDMSLFQRSASLEPQRACSAGARRRVPESPSGAWPRDPKALTALP